MGITDTQLSLFKDGINNSEAETACGLLELGKELLVTQSQGSNF